MKRFFLIFVLLLAAVFSGCISQQEFFAEKMLCIDLTNYSTTSIPECSAQEECLSLVQQSMFGFPEENFSFEAKQKLFSYKNLLARAWLYNSLALKELRQINAICSSESQQILPEHINLLGHYLFELFDSIDSANKAALSLMALERDSLEEGEIELIAEEFLFQDYAVLNDNLNDLQQEGLQEFAGSYSQKYFSEVQRFNELAQKLDFSEKFVSSYSLFDLAQDYKSLLLSPFKDQKFALQILSKTVSSMLSLLTNKSKAGSSIQYLKSLDSFELFSSVEGFAGTNASLASELSAIFRQNALHRQALKESNSALEKDISLLLQQTSSDLSALKAEGFQEFSQNILSGLFEEFSQEISVQEHSLQDISSFKQDAQQMLSNLKAAFQELSAKESLAEISLGQKTLALKELKKESLSLSEEVQFFSTEVLDSLNSLCNAKASSIEEFLQAQQGSGLKLEAMKNKLLLKLHNFREADEEKKLPECAGIVKEFSSYKSALENYAEFESANAAGYSECISVLEQALSSNAAEIFSLQPFNPLLEKIKLLDPGNSAAEQCAYLKQKILAQANSSQEGQQILGQFRKAKELFSSLEKVLPLTGKAASLQALEQKLSYFEGFFSQDSLKAENLSMLSGLEQELQEFSSSSEQLLSESLSEYLSKNYSVSAISQGTIEANKPFTARQRIEFKSPLEKPFNASFRVSIKLEQENPGIAFKPENIEKAAIEKAQLVLDFNSLKPETYYVEITSSKIIARTSEKTEVLSLSEQSALVRKTILLQTPARIDSLRISVQLESDNLELAETFALYKNSRIPVSISGNLASLTVSGAEDNTTAEFYYSIKNPVSVRFELLELRELFGGISEQTYSLEVQNNTESLLMMMLEGKSLALQSPLQENLVGSAELLSADGKSIEFSILPFQNIAFSVDLPPGAKKQYFLRFKAPSKDFYSNSLQGLQVQLQELSFSENTSIKTSAEEMLSELSLLSSQEPSLDAMKRLQELEANAKKMLSAEQELKEQENSFALLKNRLLEKISALQESAEEFKKNGFLEYSRQLEKKALEAKNALSQAELLKQQNKKDAIQLLYNAEALASAAEPKTLPEKIFEESIQLQSQVSEILSRLELLGEKPEAQRLSLKELSAKIDSFLQKPDYLQASSALQELRTLAYDTNAFFNSSLEKIASKIMQEISLFESLSSPEENPLIAELRHQLSGIPEKELLDASYIAPTSTERLQQISSSLNRLRSISLLEELSKYSVLFKAKQYSTAIDKAQGFLPELRKKLEAARQLNSEMEADLNKLKDDAVVLLSSAQDSFENAGKPAEPKKLLEKSKSELGKENYLKSISLSSQLLTSLPQASKQPSFIPIAVYPLIGLVALMLFAKYRKKAKQQNQPQPRKLVKLG